MGSDDAAGRGLPPIDMTERGAARNGVPQSLDRRLFMQLRVFSGARDTEGLASAVADSGCEAVLYEDVNDPHGVGLLTMHEDAGELHRSGRALLGRQPFAGLAYLPAFTLLGRTYALGHEPDLEDTLLHRPRRTVHHPDWPWAVWYPLRRSGAFAALTDEERRGILREHGAIGMAFGRADLAHDIRLACYGLDTNDNDFVVGLIGAELHPLSACVQMMRGTRQTSEYIERLGPFFIGRVAARFPRDT